MCGRASWIVALCFALSGCGSEALTEFSSVEDNFKVKMPGRPTLKTETMLDLSAKSYFVEPDGGIMSVWVIQLPDPIPDIEAQEALDDWQELFARKFAGKVTHTESIMLADRFPGREIRGDFAEKKDKFHIRFYLVERRIYQVIVLGRDSRVHSYDASRFFASFALLK